MANEKNAVTDISLFVSIVYGQFWNEAVIAVRAPLNDQLLLEHIEAFLTPDVCVLLQVKPFIAICGHSQNTWLD